MEKQNKKILYEVFRSSKRTIAHWRYEKRIQTRLRLKKWGQKTSPFPKLTLANEQGIIYNQFRDSYRICACPMIVTGNL